MYLNILQTKHVNSSTATWILQRCAIFFTSLPTGLPVVQIRGKLLMWIVFIFNQSSLMATLRPLEFEFRLFIVLPSGIAKGRADKCVSF